MYIYINCIDIKKNKTVVFPHPSHVDQRVKRCADAKDSTCCCSPVQWEPKLRTSWTRWNLQQFHVLTYTKYIPNISKYSGK